MECGASLVSRSQPLDTRLDLYVLVAATAMAETVTFGFLPTASDAPLLDFASPQSCASYLAKISIERTFTRDVLAKTTRKEEALPPMQLEIS